MKSLYQLDVFRHMLYVCILCAASSYLLLNSSFAHNFESFVVLDISIHYYEVGFFPPLYDKISIWALCLGYIVFPLFGASLAIMLQIIWRVLKGKHHPSLCAHHKQLWVSILPAMCIQLIWIDTFIPAMTTSMVLSAMIGGTFVVPASKNFKWYK